ncbi:hypothetical protein Pfo_020562 [Paulownia fortunei]|nr:hypothetical protein Pfo_020562 [Paulownia fortunei]
MASFTVPCPKVSPLLAASSQSNQKRHCIASFPRSESRLNPPSMLAQFQGCRRSQSDVFKVCAQLNEVAVEKTSNSVPALQTVLVKESKSHEIPDASSISVFMNQVSDIIKLVDSRDIVQLQLKQMDCELVIRKKEALPQPSSAAPVFLTPPPTHQTVLPSQLPPTNSVGSVPSTPTSAPTPPPAPAKPKSSHTPFKCPMAGNLYRSPAPGAPPFVKVGDKVQKGQVICIIEAMKLMNEIEADQSGTVVEILADDGKPVSVDMPLFIIEP